MHQQRQPRWRPTKVPILVAIGIAIVFLILVSSGCDSDWTGFGHSKVDGKGEPAKTLWDWLNLLIVPAVLASAGFLFTRSQNKATRRATETRARDEALQAYLDKMSELLIDGQLHKIADEYDKTRIAARARTLAVLRQQIGPQRKRTVLLFLREARLINRFDYLAPKKEREKDPVRRILKPEKGRDVRYYAHYVGLRYADLSKADLEGAPLISTSGEEPISLGGANLKGAKLTEADLRGADLREADLSGADLSGADLSKAKVSKADLSKTGLDLLAERCIADPAQTDLRRANLTGADLTGADLTGADLRDADLRDADLTGAGFAGADLSSADLRGAKGLTSEKLEQEAKSIEKAIMPDGKKYEGQLRDKADRGAGETDGLS